MFGHNRSFLAFKSKDFWEGLLGCPGQEVRIIDEPQFEPFIPNLYVGCRFFPLND